MGDDWLTIRWLHVLAMAFFVGGQLMLVSLAIVWLGLTLAHGAS